MEKIPTNFVEDCLKLHNEYRAIHDSAPLRINEKTVKLHIQNLIIIKAINVKLNHHAQEWADNLAKEGVVTQRALMPYGENVYVELNERPEYKLNPRKPLECWYREGRYYKYAVPQPKYLKDVCHFTQLLWRNTTSVGLGMATGLDGKIYFVCNYEPAGNVDGEFAENVLPPKEEEMELPPLENVGIKFMEAKMDTVKSMERLYAVPSEKLRVWSIWLVKIVEIAVEWQRFLHSHIDLTVRLSECLKAAEDAIRQRKEEEDQVKDALSQETYLTAYEEMKSLDESNDSSRESRRTDVAKTLAADDVETAPSSSQHMPSHESNTVEISSDMDGNANISRLEVNEGNVDVERSAADNETKGRMARAEEKASSVVASTDNSSESPARSGENEDEENSLVYTEKTWPIGRPWRPLSSLMNKKAEIEDTIQALDLPRDEEEMVQFIKNFTSQATTYRSYYKHWTETADRAIKEIGGRQVMSTVRVQGKHDRKGEERIDLQASQYPNTKDGKSKVDTTLDTSTPTTSQKPGISQAPTGQPSRVIDMTPAKRSVKESVEDASIESSPTESDAQESSQAPVVESSETDQFVTPAASKTDAPTISSNVTDTSLPKEDRLTDPIAEQLDTSDELSGMQENVENLDIDESIRNEARADEDVPYFFYLKTEADLEIAIEHDDEEVIPPDTNRENITGNYRRVHFNLTDKPGKSGKPWL